jgi:hypothetical protein
MDLTNCSKVEANLIEGAARILMFNRVALARSETIPAPGLLLLGRKLGL